MEAIEKDGEWKTRWVTDNKKSGPVFQRATC